VNESKVDLVPRLIELSSNATNIPTVLQLELF